MVFWEPFADGVCIGRLSSSTVCKILGLGDIDPCIGLFIKLESTALPSDVLCCSDKGIADHCACYGNLRLIFAPASNCMLKLGTRCPMNDAGRVRCWFCDDFGGEGGFTSRTGQTGAGIGWSAIGMMSG